MDPVEKPGTQQWDEMMAWLRGVGNDHSALALDHLLRMEMTREALREADADRAEYLRQAEAGKELLCALGAVLDVASRACQAEATAHDMIEIATDKVPFKNLMATMYGLNEVGGELPVKRQRRKAA
jgi:hypothetical protein